MAATVTIRRWTGDSGSPTKTEITGQTTRVSTSDNPSPGTNNPIPIPSSGTVYSYWLSTRLSVDATPDGSINNILWYTDGDNGYGTGITVIGQSADAYVQATGTEGESGNELTTTNHDELTDDPVDVFTFDSESPKSITGSMDNPNTGDLGQFMVIQWQIASTASAGAKTAETFTWQYDET